MVVLLQNIPFSVVTYQKRMLKSQEVSDFGFYQTKGYFNCRKQIESGRAFTKIDQVYS